MKVMNVVNLDFPRVVPCMSCHEYDTTLEGVSSYLKEGSFRKKQTGKEPALRDADEQNTSRRFHDGGEGEEHEEAHAGMPGPSQPSFGRGMPGILA